MNFNFDLKTPPYLPGIQKRFDSHIFEMSEYVNCINLHTNNQNERAKLFWRQGVLCFNHEYFWETHELWEHAWNLNGRSSQHGVFIQACIQVAALCLKWKSHQTFSNELLKRANEKFEKYKHFHVFLEIELTYFLEEIEYFKKEKKYPKITIK